MADFNITIVAIVQFIDDEATNLLTHEIYDSIVTSSDKIRYVFLSVDQNNSCKVTVKTKQAPPAETSLPGDFYNTNRDEGVIPVFLKDFVLHSDGQPVTSDKYILITIGHGAGFGMMTRRVTREEFFITYGTGIEGLSQEDSDFILEHVFVPMENDIAQALTFAANYLPDNTKRIERPPANIYVEKNRQNWTEKHAHIELIQNYRDHLPDTISYLTSVQLAGMLRIAFKEFYDAYGPVHPPVPFEVIIQVNCYMQTLENGCALSDVTTYLLATPLGFPRFGMKYSNLFNMLANNDRFEIQQLWQVASNAISARAAAQTIGAGGTNNYAYSINWLGNYTALFKKLNKLSEKLIEDYDAPFGTRKLKDHLYLLREDSNSTNKGPVSFYAANIFVDCCNYFKRLLDRLKLPVNDVSAQSIIELVELSQQCRLAAPLTDYPEGSPLYPNSFGIFFPKRYYTTGGSDRIVDDLIKDYIDNMDFTTDEENKQWYKLLRLYL